jgi:hypothetical protein
MCEIENVVIHKLLDIFNGKYILERRSFTLEWWWLERGKKSRNAIQGTIHMNLKKNTTSLLKFSTQLQDYTKVHDRTIHPWAQHKNDLVHSNASSSMKVQTAWSYKKRFLTLGGETLEARTWAWASTYEGNIKPFKGLEWNSFVVKKGRIMDKCINLKIRRT